jgi:hypothetical protein
MEARSDLHPGWVWQSHSIAFQNRHCVHASCARIRDTLLRGSTTLLFVMYIVRTCQGCSQMVDGKTCDAVSSSDTTPEPHVICMVDKLHTKLAHDSHCIHVEIRNWLLFFPVRRLCNQIQWNPGSPSHEHVRRPNRLGKSGHHCVFAKAIARS